MEFSLRKKTKPANPRKASTGTSYQAQGILPPPTLEVESGSSMPVRILDVVPELISPALRVRTFSKMMNDAGVDVSMRAAKTPVLGAEFYIDPYDDEDI